MPKFILLLLFNFTVFFIPAFAQNVTKLETVADSLSDQKNYTDAVAKYTQAIGLLKNDPKKSSELLKKRGECHESLSQHQEAVDDATLAIDLDAKNADAYWNRALAYESIKQYQLAIDDYSRTIPFYRKDLHNLSKLYKNRGGLKYELKLFKDAIIDDSVAVTINKKNGGAYWNLGIVYNELREYKKAIDNYKTAVLYEDDKVEVAKLYNNMASNYKMLNQYPAAIEQESMAISLNPEVGIYYWDRGNFYQHNKDYQFSIVDYVKAMPFYKDQPAALSILYNNKAYSEIWLGYLTETVKDNNRAIELNSDNKFAYWTKAIAMAKNGNHEQAGNLFLKAAALYKDNAKTVAVLYSDYVAEEYYKEKADTLLVHSTKAISLDPTNYSAYYVRGKVYLKKLKLSSDAVNDFDKVMELDTSKKSTSFIFALYYKGDAETASKMLKEVILSSKSDIELSGAYYNMACLCSLMHNNTDALSYLQSAISKGYNKNYAANDDDFDNIKNIAEFKRLVYSQ